MPVIRSNNRTSEAEHVLFISRIVWHDVVVPGWFLSRPPPPPATVGPTPTNNSSHKALSRGGCVAAMALAEALFPLVALACGAVLGSSPRALRTKYRSSYFALRCAAAAGGGEGERGRCVAWLLLGRRPTTAAGSSSPRRGKECLAVLWGLCVGGHLPAAKALVCNDEGEEGGSEMGHGSGWGWGGRGLKWPRNVDGGGCDCDCDGDMRDEVVSGDLANDGETLLMGVCRAGHLEVAKWLVSRFGVPEVHLFKALMAALEGGRVSVVEWLARSFDVTCCAEMLRAHYALVFCASIGGCLDAIKCRDISSEIARDVLRSKRTPDEKIESCKWLMAKFPSLAWSNFPVHQGKVLRWLLQMGSFRPTQTTLFFAFYNICDHELVEQLLQEYHLVVQPKSFVVACENHKDDVSVVKCLLRRVPEKDLTPELLEKALSVALEAENLSIATWLEDTYHCTERANKGYPTETEEPRKSRLTLPAVASVCSASNFTPLDWFWQRLSGCTLREDDVFEAVDHCCWNITAVLFLFKKFPFPRDHGRHKSVWKKLLSIAVGMSDITSAQRLIALGAFTQAEVVECLTKYNNQVCSTNRKSKWLLISHRKTSGTRWLIDTYHIGFHDLMETPLASLTTNISLSMWKLLLRRFREITAGVVRDQFMGLVVTSPEHIEFTVRKLGLTLQEIIPKFRTILENPDYPTSTETTWWLAQFTNDDGTM
ncbi:hypothetical protein Pelo_16313 [Pelomyxa schiedti]|nr:hypothetical protein Pelo_16313 [Pelomyxa schiedti]